MKFFCRFQTSILILRVFDKIAPLLDPRPPTLARVFFLGVKQTKMKRIQIRRKKRKPETPPPPPEPAADAVDALEHEAWVDEADEVWATEPEEASAAPSSAGPAVHDGERRRTRGGAQGEEPAAPSPSPNSLARSPGP